MGKRKHKRQGGPAGNKRQAIDPFDLDNTAKDAEVAMTRPGGETPSLSSGTSSPKSPSASFPSEFQAPSADQIENRSYLHRAGLDHDIEFPLGPWVFARCPPYEDVGIHGDTAIVAFSAISQELKSGGSLFRSAVGVFYGQNNTENTSSLLEPPINSLEAADLQACTMVLFNMLQIKQSFEMWWNQRRDDGVSRIIKLAHVVLKSDSSYVVHGITQALPRWKEHGWAVFGHEDANIGLWQIIDHQLGLLEEMLGIRVSFWFVPCALNQNARDLAQAMLDGGMSEI